MRHNFNAPYDTLPSIQLNHRPFFSIVVPCYNPSKYIEDLLNSIVKQHMNDDLEIILADDHSTENYQEIINKYNKDLCIKQILTDYNFAPGNTRQKGVSIAQGEWLTFIDQDDIFIEDSLSIVKQEIIKNKEKYHVITNFYQTEPDSQKIIRCFVGPRNWCHGKFYNLDNFWRRYNFHFKKDLKTHQDIYISCRVKHYLDLINDDHPLYIDMSCYIWRAFPQSISRSIYDQDENFIQHFFNDYLISTGYNLIDLYNNTEYDESFKFWDNRKDYIRICLIDGFLFTYFYFQSFVFHKHQRYLVEQKNLILDYYKKAHQILDMTDQDIIQTVGLNDATWYGGARETAIIGTGNFIQQQTFSDFLKTFHNLAKEQSE